ncbi:MAG: hypothetical protein R3Y06_04360 [Faecalibacterium sp.]
MVTFAAKSNTPQLLKKNIIFGSRATKRKAIKEARKKARKKQEKQQDSKKGEQT